MNFGGIGQTKYPLRPDATRWDLMGSLGRVLKELKKITLHLMLVTDTKVDNEDVENA